MDPAELLQELIRFPSVSSTSNREITDFVDATLQKLGFATERIGYLDPSGVAKENVIGKLGTGTGGVAYFGHTDVVPAQSWHAGEAEAFAPVIRDGRLYGRGACDMKGSVAAMLAAASRIDAGRLQAPVYLTCTADEEIGYGGARAVAAESSLYREMIQGETRGIIGEPTCLRVVYAHKGTCGMRAVSRGRASHSSTREGLNANLAMIPYLQEMKAIHDELEREPRWQDPAFDPPTMSWNIGVNDFTYAYNITPPRTVCTVYFRPMPGQDIDPLVARARAAAEACGIEFVVDVNAPPFATDPDSPFVADLLALTGQSRAETVCYGTDGAMFGEFRDMVVLGPGSIAQAHTDDEFIELEQLQRGVALYRQIVEKYCYG